MELDPALQKHPRVLFYLIFTETWERFSFYGMKALLIFYLTKAFLFSDKAAYAIYGSYTALVYATPVLGGLLADRLLGFRKAVLIGGVLMALGHFAMAVPNLQVFYVALALLICGNGFFKPNISSLVGACTARMIPAAIQRSRSFTWASTSAPSSRRSLAATWGNDSAGTGALVLPGSACCSA